MKNRSSVILYVLFLLVLPTGCREQAAEPKPVDPVEMNAVTDTAEQSNPVNAVEPVEVTQIIEAAGGKIQRDANGKIEEVDLASERTSVSNEVLKQALSLADLKSLRVASGNFSEEAWADLGKHKRLETLFLQDLPVSNDEFVKIVTSCPKLQRLTIRRLNHVDDAGITAMLAILPLKSLSLIESNLTRQGLEAIVQSPNITALDIRQSSRLSPDDYQLLERMPKLSDLKIGGFGVNDSVLEKFPNCSKLRSLSIEDSTISSDGFAKLASHQQWASQLEFLAMSRNMSLYDAALDSLQAFDGLKRLTVRDMMVTGDFLQTLAKTESIRTNLETLSLAKTFVTPDNIRLLSQFPKLKKLDISNTTPSSELLEAVKSLDQLDTVVGMGGGIGAH